MLAPPPGRGRREAIPRMSNAVQQHGDADALLFGASRMTAATMMVDAEKDDFYWGKDKQEVLAGPFTNIRVLLTAGANIMRKWVDTKIIGTLRLVKVQQVATCPVVMVQVHGQDEAGSERAIVLQYELPINFRAQ